MKRTTSTLAALGLALSGTVALAGAYIPPGGRFERQPAAEPANAGPQGPVPPPAARPAEPRGGGWNDGRGGRHDGDDRREDRRDERRDGRRDDRRDDRQDAWRDERRDGWREGRRDDWRGERRDDRRDEWRGDRRDWRDGRREWHDDWARGRGPSRGWHDDRGREWRHRREWYDQYRADRWRYDRGRWYARQRFSIGIYVLPRGHAPRYWQRGHWLPAAYYGERRWHLGDYWRFGLYDPPFAAGWVRVGDDALLIDLRSGEVLDVVCELFW